MIRNYFKVALRNLSKNKGYGFLNIFGLAIGITCASLIFLWIEDELSFNQSFANKEQVYYVPTNQQYDGVWRTFYSTPGPLAQALKDEVPGIKRSARTVQRQLVFTTEKEAFSRAGKFADEDFLKIFDLSFIAGSADKAFKNPNGIVINKDIAKLLYDEPEQALGKTIKVNNRDLYEVTGVIQNQPKNVTFDFDWVAPFERVSKGQDWMTYYGNNFADTFVELAPGVNVSEVDAKVRKLVPEKNPEDATYAFLHSMKDWHLRSKFEDGNIVGGRIEYVYLFSIIAVLILCIACINFMNLSTARSEKRANEVGVRKAIGSSRRALVTQFMSEAVLISLMATVLSVILLFIILPQFNLLIEKDLTLEITNPLHWISLLMITIMCGVFAGLYPAFYLSSFRPIKVLKGIKATSGSASLIRKGLVVLQFSVSIVFIISTIIVYQQIQHVKNRELGYDKDHLISLKVSGEMINNFSAIRHDLINSGLVKNAALCNSNILSGGNNGSGFSWPGSTNSEDILISFREVNASFFETTGMNIIEGRGLDQSLENNSNRILISQSLAKLMGDESPIGQMMRRGDENYEVVGVVEDYIYGDIYTASDPVMFFNTTEDSDYMYIKLKAGNDVSETLATIKGILRKNNPGFPFSYAFVDEGFDQKFKSEQMVGKLSQLFALLTILISCLGLFGLAAYTAEQRRKEIGIRKVLGASVATIVKLLSTDFLKLICISFFIAFPIGYYLMTQWLQGFEYRIDIQWWIFITAAMTTMLIAISTISWQSIKAATLNPIKSLRTE